MCRMLEANVMLKLMDDVNKRVLTQHFVILCAADDHKFTSTVG